MDAIDWRESGARSRDRLLPQPFIIDSEASLLPDIEAFGAGMVLGLGCCCGHSGNLVEPTIVADVGSSTDQPSIPADPQTVMRPLSKSDAAAVAESVP